MSSFWTRNTISQYRKKFPVILDDVLFELEFLDKKWSVKPPDENHTYGRLPGETELRLWNVPESTGAFLYWFCKLNNLKNIVEIGTSAGYSTLWIAQALSEFNDGMLNTWEILPEKAKLAESFIQKSNLSKFIKVWNEDAKNIPNRIRSLNSIDLAFIDADKEKYDMYYSTLITLLKKGGFIIVDNAVDSGGLMINFINKLMNVNEWNTFIFDIDNGILVAQKIT